jgi:UDPglucose 6-dehydrogenase
MELKILNAVMDVNEGQKTILVPKLKNYFGGSLAGKKIALWGLAFKPNTDDIREAPALYIIDELLKEGCSICAYDPEAMENVQSVLGDKISYGESQYQVLKDADALVVATEWSVFRTPDFDKMTEALKNKVIFDGRNLYDTEHIKDKGFEYFSIGRP